MVERFWGFTDGSNGLPITRYQIYPGNVKTCSKCEETKPLLEFGDLKPRREDLPRPYKHECKVCEALRRKKWDLANTERRRAKVAEYYWEHKNDPVSPERTAQLRARAIEYGRSHPEVVRRCSMRKKATKLQATVPWASEIAIGEIYKCAVSLSQDTGTMFHVDHIIPLKSDLVCGFHCEFNMDIITAEANMRKKNVLWPDMPVIDAELKVLVKEFKAKEKETTLNA